MSFLHPALLLALPAVFIPLIIHLLHRRRFRKKAWGAMRFLREALEEKRGRRRLRHWIILTMRTLVMAVLIFAVSRPLVGGWLAGWIGGGEKRVMILMDRSASMDRRLNANGPGKRETALGMLSDACKELSPSEIWVYDSASREERMIEDASDLSRELTATATVADVPAMLRQALEDWKDSGHARGEIWLVSDLQSSNWKSDHGELWADLEAVYDQLVTPPGIRLLTLPGGQANRSIRCEPRQRRLEVTIHQGGASSRLDPAAGEETVLPLTLRLGEQKTIHEVSLAGETTKATLELSGEGALTGSVSLPDDGNPADNRAFFAVPPRARPRVVIFCEDKNVEAVLGLAVSPWPEGTEGMAEIVRLERRSEVEVQDWEGVALIIWQGELPAGESAIALQRAVNSGGQVLFFPGTGVSGDVRGTAWNGLSFGGMQSPEGETAWAIREWSRDEGPVRDTNTGEMLPLSQWMTHRYATVNVDAGSRVRARFASGDPCLVSQTQGKGEAHFCATLPLADWSSLGEGVVLVPFVQRLLTAGVRGRSPVSWSAPSGAPWQAGVWEEESGAWTVAVRPEEEDLPEEVTADELRALMGGVPFQEFALQEGDGSAEALSDWWRPFFFLALLFLVGESTLTMMPRSRTPSTAASP